MWATMLSLTGRIPDDECYRQIATVAVCWQVYNTSGVTQMIANIYETDKTDGRPLPMHI